MLKTSEECIEYIHSAGKFGKKTGLDNIKALLAYLGNPQKELNCVHIAGTNGKGSVACMLVNILAAAGYKAGLNSSPYIENFTERISVNGAEIPESAFVRLTNEVKNAVDALKEKGICPIEFEIITALGFLYFKEEKCDFAVLECGLGGRFDATNVIEKSALSVICAIGLDHTQILGDTIEKIAFEKAGILKENCPVVLHPCMRNEAKTVIEKRAKELSSPLFKTENNAKILKKSLSGTDFEINGNNYHVNLNGDFQVGNAALAVNAAKILAKSYSISEENIAAGLKNARWKCRFEYFPPKDKGGVSFVIDGAHNPDGVSEFSKSVSSLVKNERKVFIIGVLNDKDTEKCADVIANLPGKVIVTDVPSARQTSGKDVFDIIARKKENCTYVPNFKAAVKIAKNEVSPNGFVCVAGSLYLAGEVRKFLRDA